MTTRPKIHILQENFPALNYCRRVASSHSGVRLEVYLLSSANHYEWYIEKVFCKKCIEILKKNNSLDMLAQL